MLVPGKRGALIDFWRGTAIGKEHPLLKKNKKSLRFDWSIVSALVQSSSPRAPLPSCRTAADSGSLSTKKATWQIGRLVLSTSWLAGPQVTSVFCKVRLTLHAANFTDDSEHICV